MQFFENTYKYVYKHNNGRYSAQFEYKGVKYSRCHPDELTCVAYVNYWHTQLKLPIPYPNIKPIKPPPKGRKRM